MFKNVILSNPTLVIKAGSSALAKHSAFQYLYRGVLTVKAAWDCPALTGTTADDYKRVYFLYINDGGTLSWDVSEQVPLATNIDINELRRNKLALDDEGQLLVGWLVVINETAANFVGWTTALDVANSTVYYHNVYGLVEQDTVL